MTDDEKMLALNAVLGLPETLEELDQMCDVVIPDAIEALDGDPQALAVLMYRLNKIAARLKGGIQDVEDALIESMPGKDMMVPGIGEIEWHGAKSRKQWQHDQLVPRVTDAIAQDVTVWHDFETGETYDSNDIGQRSTITARVVERLRDIATLSWKVGKETRSGSGEYEGGLRSINIDPDEFCTTEWGRKKVQFPTDDTMV